MVLETEYTTLFCGRGQNNVHLRNQWKSSRLRSDLYCVGWDVTLYSLSMYSAGVHIKQTQTTNGPIVFVWDRFTGYSHGNGMLSFSG